MESSSEEDLEIDPCTGFPTVNKAKLSIPSIAWHIKQGSGVSSGNDPHCDSTSPTTDPETQNVRGTWNKRCLGLSLTVLSAITFSFNALIAKLLNHFHPFNLGVWTFQLMTLFALFGILYEVKIKKNEVFRDVYPLNFKENWKIYLFLFIRAICGVSALIFFFYAMKHISVGDALVIDASSPIFVYLMAFLFLKEKCGLLPILTTIGAFFGIALITRPPLLTGDTEYDMNSLIGSIFAFCTMFCIAISIIAMKSLQEVHHGIINFTFALWGTVQCVVISISFGALALPSELTDILKIVATAVLFFVGQALITLALKFEEAGPVGLLRTTEVVFAFVWQFVFLGVAPDLYSCFGAILVLISAVLTILRNWISTLPSNSEFRNKCGFLMY